MTCFKQSGAISLYMSKMEQVPEKALWDLFVEESPRDTTVVCNQGSMNALKPRGVTHGEGAIVRAFLLVTKETLSAAFASLL